MPQRRLRARRPIAWNQLLRKGHAHSVSRTAQRRSTRRALEDEADEFWTQRQHDTDESANADGAIDHTQAQIAAEPSASDAPSPDERT